MGIINVTPDSFADGGVRADPDRAIQAALEMEAQGADLIDVGGESTRPGAVALPAEEEWRRVGPVLEGLRGRLRVPISIDTYKADIAARAIDCGAAVVNDVSALAYDPALARVVAERQVPIVLMHNRGRSAEMYAPASYDDVVADVIRELVRIDRTAQAAGISPERIIWDPGLGFAKKAHQTLAVLAGLAAIVANGRPVLVGPSKKSYLTAAVGDLPADERGWGTAAAVTASVLFGAHIVRVHDVPEMVQVVRVADRILELEPGA